MKVYIVSEYSISGWFLRNLEIFKTRESAEKYAMEQKRQKRDPMSGVVPVKYEINEFNLCE